jgi:hypothetical protein
MEADKPNLYVSFEPPENVVFTRNKFVVNSQWDRIIRWWNDGDHSISNENKFIVPFHTFDFKKNWLRTDWASIGLFTLSEDLKTELRKSKKINDEFDMAKNHNRTLPDLNWKSLNLKRSPTKEQATNVQSMISIRNGANFSVPGAGKTMTTLATWKFLQQRNEIDKLLIICPKSAFEAWTEEEPKETFNEHINTQVFNGKQISPQTEILVTNYEKLENKNYLQRISQWMFKQSTMLVLDEAHRVKGGSNSARWRACKKISNIASRVDLLTGTPMPQDYSDLRNLLSLSWKNVSKPKLSDVDIMHFQRGGLFVRTTKSELKLPRVELKQIEVPQSEIQKQIYSALRRTYAGNFLLSPDQEDHFKRRGRAVMSLLGAATNPGLLAGMQNESAFMHLKWPPKELSHDKDLISVVEDYVSIETPEKYIWLEQFIKKEFQKKNKVLVWSSFVGNLRAVNRLLEPFNPAMVFGNTAENDRKIQIAKFRNDESCGVLITNPQTLGEGISLHKVCHTAVYIDRTFNAGQYLQSLDRIHRLGLPEDIITKIYFLKTRHTIDERVSSRLEAKISRMSDVLNDFGLIRDSIPNFDELEKFDSLNLDADDMEALLGHLRTDE